MRSVISILGMRYCISGYLCDSEIVRFGPKKRQFQMYLCVARSTWGCGYPYRRYTYYTCKLCELYLCSFNFTHIIIHACINNRLYGTGILEKTCLCFVGPGLIILTDGVLGFSSPSSMHTSVNAMRGANISCWTVQVTLYTTAILRLRCHSIG